MRLKKLLGLTQTACYEHMEKPRSKVIDLAGYLQGVLESSGGLLLKL